MGASLKPINLWNYTFEEKPKHLICQGIQNPSVKMNTHLKAIAVNIIFIWSIVLQSHIQLILQMYLDIKRFAVLLLLPIQHIDGNTVFPLSPTSGKTETNCLLKRKGCIYSEYYTAHTRRYQLPPHQTLRACTYTSYMVKYIANRCLCV